MPRVTWVVAAGYPRRITKKGNYHQKIFADDTDRRKYFSLLKEESNRYHLTISAYCLMSNHIHFMVIPQREDSMRKVFKYTNMKYFQYFNNKMKVKWSFIPGLLLLLCPGWVAYDSLYPLYRKESHTGNS